MLRKLGRSLPVQLLLVIGFVLLFGDYCSLFILRSSFTISLLFRQFLALSLPFIVFSFILAGIIALKKNAPLILSVLLASVVCSNVIVSFFAYIAGRLALPFLTNGIVLEQGLEGRVLEPFGIVESVDHVISWMSGTISQVPVLSWIFPLSAEKSMLAAVGLGILFSVFASRVGTRIGFLQLIEKSVLRFKSTVECVLKRLFIPLLPLYVLGFLLELNYRQAGWGLLEYYGRTLVFIFCLHIIYLCLLYFVAAKFSFSGTVKAIKVSISSYLTALSTMSSTATIPVTVNVGAINTGNRPLAEVSAPILANVHLVGDSISTPLLALVTVYLFLGTTVSFASYALFVFYFCQTMLAVSGIPGGGIIVMIPILESVLHFNPKMVSLITTLYLLQDAFGTAANVMGDGALMMIVDNILKWCKIRKSID